MPMGGIFSKKKNDAVVEVTAIGAEQDDVKHVGLLVLHSEPKAPNMRDLSRAIRQLPPPGSIAVEEKKIADNRENMAGIREWISTWLNNDKYIVLICLLTDYNLSDLVSGIDIKNHPRIIGFSFRATCTGTPYPGFITLDISYSATINEIKEKFGKVEAKIRAGNRE